MKSLVPYFLLCCTTLIHAQGWQQTFNGLLNPAAVLETPDGGAVLLSSSVPGGAQGRQIILIKTDQDGQLQWQKIFGAPGDDEGRSMVLSSTGNIVLAGKISFVTNNGDALLAVYNLNGQKLWERNYNFGVLDDAKCVRQMTDGGFVLAVEADNQLRILRTDAAGNELWSKAYPSTQNLIVKHLEVRSDGGFVATLLRNNLPIGAPAAVVLQISASGDLEFQTTLPHLSNFVTTDLVRCKPASDSTFWLMHRDSVYLLDRDTSVLKSWRLASPFDLYLTDLIPAEDGGFFALGTNYSFSGTAFSRTYFARFQADGTEVWQRYFTAPNYLHSSWAAIRTKDGGFFLTGNYAKNGAYFSYILRTDSLGQAFTNKISGRVYWDKNNDCSTTLNEPSLSGWLLKVVRPNGAFHYATTDSTGHYAFDAGLGEHKVSILLPNGLWAAVCSQDVSVTFDAAFQSKKLDFHVKSSTFCPLPRVDAGIDYWLHCAENSFMIRYANTGTEMAENSAITLKLDSLLTLTGASQAFSQIGAHTWRFPLGNLPPLTDSSFLVNVHADCSLGTLDRTLCIETNIEPDAPCLAPLNGPLLIAEGRCDGDSVRFEVRNIGLPMTESQPYIVVEDDVMLLQGLELMLGTGETLTLSLPANGSTWRFEVLQSPGIPDWQSDPHVAAAVEGCSASGSFSTGYINQFSLYDGGYFSETECRPVVANAQGQEKTAYPAGWNAEHLIPANTDLEYALHFQNTSGDTVRVLTLRDTLDHLLLNPASFEAGPASHPYEFDLSGQGVLTFRFIGTELADSARAWVKFRISQTPDLPNGTVIYNRAWAYPGFMAPLATNETFHTIGDPLLSGTGGNPKPPLPPLRVWPIPTTAGVSIEMSQSGEYVCQLTDILGRLILERDFSGKLLELSDPELPAGVFIATVFKNGQRFGQVQIVKLSR
jgi:hypothetical protein